MSQRSVLRIREHIHPQRRDETVVEVLRDGVVVASIYGSREGIHIVTERQPQSRVFAIEGNVFPTPGWSVTLLAEGETCPWCQGRQTLKMPEGPMACPVCGPLEKA